MPTPPAWRLSLCLLLLALLAGCAGRELAVHDPAPGEGLSMERALILPPPGAPLAPPSRSGATHPTPLACPGWVRRPTRPPAFPLRPPPAARSPPRPPGDRPPPG